MKVKERRSHEPAQGTRHFHTSGIAPGFLSGGVTYGHICLAPPLRFPSLAVPGAPDPAPSCPHRARAVRVPARSLRPHGARARRCRGAGAAGSCSPFASPPWCSGTARLGARNYTIGETRWRRLFVAVAKELVSRLPSVSAHGQPAVGDPPVAGERQRWRAQAGPTIPERTRAARPARKLQLPASTATRRSPGRGLRGAQSPRPLRVLRK